MNGTRKNTSAIGWAALLAASLVCVWVSATPAQAQQFYLGSEFCADCHMDKFNDFKLSGHPYKLMRGSEAQARAIPLPEGYTWDDIAYVIGGFRWKARFIGNDGYIITSLGDGTPGMNQYNFLTHRWVDYNPGQQKPYDCGRCHTTGFSPGGNQDGLPGISGTWALDGIQCEACHGGESHFGDNFMKDGSGAFCGTCHVRGDPATIPARGGFIRHHEQWNEQLASPHAALDCTDCHDPHKPSATSIHTECRDCHADIAASYANTVMDRWEVDCIDCHMPRASKSADALGPYEGDVRTHLFNINPAADGQLFTADGDFVQLSGSGTAAVTVDFACLSCHKTEGRRWASFYARDFHDRDRVQDVIRDPTESPIKRFLRFLTFH